MQISDKLGQYSRNVTNGTEELHGAQGVQKLVSTVNELAAGSVFEGTVNQVKNGKVTLALGNGQLISARLDGKIDIKPGASMFFQVRSNDGTTVSIRPYTGAGNAGNPILLNALTAAGVPVTERSLSMVDVMMKEQMPIGRQSILDMVKVLNNNPGTSVETLVSMTKLGIPVTEAMAAQFENYVTDRHAILNEMELAVGQLTAALGDGSISEEDAFSLYGKLLTIFNGGAEGSGETALNSGIAGGGASGIAGNPGQEAALGGNSGAASGIVENPNQEPASSDAAGTLPEAGKPAESPVNSAETAAGQPEAGKTAENPAQAEAVQNQPDGIKPAENTASGSESVENQTEAGKPADGPEAGKALENQPEAAGRLNGGNTLGNLFSEEQLKNLAKQLKNMPALNRPELLGGATEEDFYVDTMKEDGTVLAKGDGGSARPDGGTWAKAAAPETLPLRDMTSGEFLMAVQKALAQNSQYGFAGLTKLFSGKEFQKALRDVVEQQWLLKPEDLKQQNKISELYERMEHQIRQMETAMKAAGISQNSFLQTASDIRGNIEFMNQMNQMYTYVQMPLKLSGQNANGELYVYTNKKKFTDPEAELSAFLHLDLENLGSTDVSVRMRNRKVNTNFYLPDDKAFGLVEKHLPILERRLKDKGYSCTVTITHEKKEVNFVEDLFRREQAAPAGSLHRYSFDVRA